MPTITVPNLKYCGIADGGWGIFYVEAALFVSNSRAHGGHSTSWGCLDPIGSDKALNLPVQILAYMIGVFLGLLQPHGFVIDTCV
jgi:hypothetical protein